MQVDGDLQRSMDLAAERVRRTGSPVDHSSITGSRYTRARFEMLSASATGGLRPTSPRAVPVELPSLSRTPCLAQ